MYLAVLGMLFGFIAGFLLPSTAVAAASCEVWIAKAVSVQGAVQVRRAGATQWMPVQLHDTFCPGDIIWVQEWSRFAIIAQNGTVHRLDQNTTITIAAPEPKQ